MAYNNNFVDHLEKLVRNWGFFQLNFKLFIQAKMIELVHFRCFTALSRMWARFYSFLASGGGGLHKVWWCRYFVEEATVKGQTIIANPKSIIVDKAEKTHKNTHKCNKRKHGNASVEELLTTLKSREEDQPSQW